MWESILCISSWLRPTFRILSNFEIFHLLEDRREYKLPCGTTHKDFTLRGERLIMFNTTWNKLKDSLRGAQRFSVAFVVKKPREYLRVCIRNGAETFVCSAILCLEEGNMGNGVIAVRDGYYIQRNGDHTRRSRTHFRCVPPYPNPDQSPFPRFP